MVVLDCSAAIEMCRNTQKGRALRALLLEGEQVVAPGLLKVELRNVVWKYRRAGHLGEAEANLWIQTVLSVVDSFVPSDANIDEAYAEANLRNHPVYDMLYATLARRHACCLFTLDKRLVTVCQEMGVNCIEEVAL